jgi:PAS domain S-box-containing protein
VIGRPSDDPAGLVVTTATPAMSRPLRRSWIVTAAVVLLGLVVVLASDVLSADSEQALSVVMQSIAAGLAFWATLGAARRAAEPWRRAWRWLALSTGLWLAGNLTNIAVGLLSDAVFPSVADALLLPALPAAIIGLLVVPGRLDWKGRSRLGIDGLLLGGSLLYITWVRLIGRAFTEAQFGSGTKAVLLAYWVLDSLVLAVSLGLLLRSRPGARRTQVLLCAGYVAYMLTDAAFIRRSIDGVLDLGALGGPGDAGWVLGLLLIAAAAVTFSAADDVAARAPRARASDRRVLFGSLLTFVPFFAVFVVSATRPDLHGGARVGAATLLIATAALFVYSQFTTLRENLRLEGGLESTVAARTVELQGAVELQDLTLRAVNDGILGLGHDGRLVLSNDAACEMLRLPADQIIGRYVYEVVTVGPEDRSLLVSIQEHIDDGRSFAIDDVEVQRNDGTRLSIELTVTPVSQDHPMLTSVAVFRDVTHRHEVDRMKDEFVSVVSHELRTPLTSIRGSLGLLAGGAAGELPEQGRRMVDIAVENTDRLIRLINDILDIERIQSGAVVLHRQHCQAAELIAESLRVVVPLAREAGVEVGLAKVEGVVDGDRDRLVQTLTNLVSNAVKFSPRGGIVTLAARNVGADVLFTVSDEGRGIPADRLESIFGRFQQVDASDSRTKGGTGLGLAITRSIVEQHGGRIWAESTLGEGSTFSFTIPAAAEAPARPLDPVGEGPLVLVCDDDRSLLEVAQALLSSHGYRVIVAQTGAEAVELAAREHPAVIVLDLFMPEMDGWGTVEALKARPETADIPVLVLSVLDEDDGVGLGDRVEAWLTKPGGANDALLAAVDELLGSDSNVPRVLVVEDDEDLARVLATSLERRGLRVLVAPTVAAATRMSRTFLPDMIVLDIVLPDGDGFAVVEQLRHDGRLSSIPLLVYTARELDERDAERLTLGETEILFKSKVDPATFETRVLALLEGVVGDAGPPRPRRTSHP